MTDTTDRLKGLASKAKEKEIANILRKLNDGKTLTATEQKRLDDWSDSQPDSDEVKRHPVDPKATIRTAALVDWFGVSAVTIAKLANDGILVRQKAGIYLIYDSVKNYVKYLRKDRQSKFGSEGGETNQNLRDALIREQARKERALASLRELELEMKEKALVPESDLMDRLSDLCIPLRRLLDALPKAVAAQANPGEPNVAEIAIRKGLDQRVFSEIQRILNKAKEQYGKDDEQN